MNTASLQSVQPQRAGIAALFILLTMLVGGCATTPTSKNADDPAGTAVCPVCEKHGDLACLNVKVTDQTPRSVYLGETYYFCSPECKSTFDQNPSKYR